MENEYSLGLAEILLFITHHPNKSAFRGNETYLKVSLCAALLLDLQNKGVINFNQKKVHTTVKKADLNDVEKRAYAAIEQARKPKQIRYWLSYLFSKSKLTKWDIWEAMIPKGLVRLEKRKFLGFIPYHVSSVNQTLLQSKMIRALEMQMLRPQKENQEDIWLLALIHGSDAYRIFSSSWKERTQLRKKVKSLINQNPIHREIEELIKEINNSATIAMMAATSGSVATR